MTVKGIFVSHWQGQINWSKVAEAGYRYAWIKATEGMDFVDPAYKRNVTGAKAAGLDVGSLHFYLHGDPIEEQVKHFAGVATAFDLGWAWDVEGVNWTNRRQTAHDLLWLVENWAEYFYDLPVIYANLSTLDQLSKWADDLYISSWLWVAAWRPVDWGLPDLDPWHPAFWQHTCTGRVPGIWGDVCLDRYIGLRPYDEWVSPPPAPPRNWSDLSEPERWGLVRRGLWELDILDNQGNVQE